MRQATFLSAFLSILVFLYSIPSTAQCPVAPAAVPCTGTEALVTADETLLTGTTKWYYGTVATFNSLTLKGGKLVICGDLTIDKFYMESGEIIVNPGGRFVIGSGLGEGLILRGGCAIYNHGTLEIQRNLSLDNGATLAAPNILVNARWNAVFKMSNQYFVINNPHSWFVNNGSAQFWGIITDPQSSPGSICLGPSSTTTMAVLINKVANTYRVSSGNACVYVHQFSEFFGSLTNSPNLFVCLSAGHTSNSGCIPFGCMPNAWGSAQVITSCSNCASLGVLPLQFISFFVEENNNQLRLQWEFDRNIINYIFYVERSANGKNFFVLDSLAAGSGKNFSYKDVAAPPGRSYYRIRAVEKSSGRSVTSKIISHSLRRPARGTIYPSPFSRTFMVALPAGTVLEKISAFDLAGRPIGINYRQVSTHQWQVTPAKTLLEQEVIFVRVATSYGSFVEKIIHQ